MRHLSFLSFLSNVCFNLSSPLFLSSLFALGFCCLRPCSFIVVLLVVCLCSFVFFSFRSLVCSFLVAVALLLSSYSVPCLVFCPAYLGGLRVFRYLINVLFVIHNLHTNLIDNECDPTALSIGVLSADMPCPGCRSRPSVAPGASGLAASVAGRRRGAASQLEYTNSRCCDSAVWGFLVGSLSLIGGGAPSSNVGLWSCSVRALDLQGASGATFSKLRFRKRITSDFN